MRCLALLLLLLALAGRAAGQDGDVRVRITVDPAEGAVIGQRIRLFVDVLFPDEMPHPPKVAAPEIPGAQLFRFESQATTMSDRLDGRSYVGQRFEYALYPRRGGNLTVPPFTATLVDREGNSAGSVHSDPSSFAVTVPPGIDASQPVVASTEISADEQWSPDPTGTFAVGDALKRTVTRTAADVPGSALAALDLSTPAGTRSYADSPEIADHMDRGEVTGRRTDRVTYVFEKPGRYRLPDADQPWWDLDKGKATSATLPGVEIEVRAVPTSQGAQRRTVERSVWLPAAVFGIGLVAMVAMGWWLRPRFIAAWRRRQSAWMNSEPAAFRVAIKASQSGDAGAAYRALMLWLNRCSPRLDAALRSDPRSLAVPLDRLRRSLFAPNISGWTHDDGRELMIALRRARRNWLPTRRRRAGRLRPLPPLNPGLPSRGGAATVAVSGGRPA